jgi:hypothetical protein
MSDIDSLIDQYGEDNVKKAFWLQDEIRKDGLDGIHFMKYAETEVSQYAGLITYQSIRSELKKRF